MACNDTEIVQRFEELMKRKLTEQFPKIYTSKTHQHTGTKQSYNQEDVITNISSQMKAMQNADCVNKYINVNKMLMKHENSQFLPVDVLEMHYEVTQKKQTKFETQFELDTQLMNIIDDVGTVNTCKGITQEFNMSFDSKQENCNPKPNLSDNKVLSDLLDVSSPPPGKEDDTSRFNASRNGVQSILKVDCNDASNKPTDIEIETVIKVKKDSLENSKVIEDCETGAVENISKEVNSSKMQLDANYPELIDKCMEIEEILNVKDIVINETAISPSPILNINKFAGKSVNSSPLLVYNLDSFEKFEEIAIPIVEETADMNKAKHLIHSQIIGRELILQTNLDSELCEVQVQLSPVLTIGTDKLKEPKIRHSSLNTDKNVTKELFDFEGRLNKCQVSDITNNAKEKGVTSKSFGDEVLFSSDEEADNNKELSDLPFTCALETSFYDQPDVLDKTMYVGFQTASNRSIQISTVSFTKAKSLLDELKRNVNTNDPSLKDLVEKCDNICKVNNTPDKICEKTNTINERKNPHIIVPDETNANSELCNGKLDKVKSQFQDIKSSAEDNIKFKKPLVGNKIFDGFKTASNKRIKLSDQALTRCKRVFQDIDLDDTFGDSNDTQNNYNVNSKLKNYLENESCTEKENKLIDLNLTKMDDVILQEFEGEMYIADNYRKKDTSGGFLTFKTASDKDIKISEKVLAKAKQIFDDIDFSEISTNNFEENHTDKKKLLQNKVIATNHDVDKNPCESSKFQRNVEIGFVGFKTASNKHINVSEKALDQIKNVFHDIDLEMVAPKIKANDAIDPNVIESSSRDKSQHDSSFKPNVRKINEAPVETETYLVKNVDSTRNNSEISTFAKHFENSSSTSNKHFMGFRTGNNDKIMVSKIALAKTKYVFQDIETSGDVAPHRFDLFINEKATPPKVDNAKIMHVRKNYKEFNQDFDSQPYVKELPFQGFKTANNKSVNISEEALEKSKKIFENFSDDASRATTFEGFQTDTNQKPVSAEEYFCSKSNTAVQGIDKKSNAIVETGFKGFQTASNKKVEISREALAISRKILDNSDLSNDLHGKEITPKYFQTANNEKIKISTYAIPQSKSIFQGSNIDENNKENNEFRFEGFQTANNKEVKVSTEALVESRKIFEDIPLKSIMPTHGIHQEIGSFTGFQTASNKKVIVPDDALVKSKQIMSEVNFVGIDEDLGPKLSQVFRIKTANNSNIRNKISGMDIDLLKKSSNIDITNNFNVINEDNMDNSVVNLNIVGDLKKHNQTENIKKEDRKNDKSTSINDINLENLINTQVINNFEEAMNTEEFVPTPKQQKRSASPILSCPKAIKRKKFDTPYMNYKIKTDISIKRNYVDLTEIFDPDYKKNKRYTLKDLQILNNNEKDKHIDGYILNFDHNNLLNFEFTGERNGLTESNLTIELLKDYFKKVVNKKLIPDNWLDNHLKLILWKLLSYELKFPKIMSGICTAKNVLKQLKHRYRRELYNAERPAIRKILERDDVASKLLVLCVMEIYHGVEENGVATTTEMLLTDGWYCIKACIDRTLVEYINDGKITIGSKIVTHGAELLNCEQGVAPWEDTSSVRLKLFGNSTRRARWDARLGFHGNAAILSRLSDVKPDGGKVSKLRVVITRVYPPLYVEKFEDGSTVTRSERLEHIHQMKHESDRQAMVEKLYEEVEKELSDEESTDSDIDVNMDSLDSGSQIARLLKRSKEPSQFRANLTESQKKLLYDHSMKKRDRILQNMQEKVLSKMDKCGLREGRNVVPLLKVRIAGVDERNGQVDVTKAQLSIWKPNDALMELMTEGACVEIMNVVPTAVRYSELQLSAGRQTAFKPCNFKENEKIKPYITSLHRTCYPIKDLTTHPTRPTDYNEIDTIGIVFQIDPSNREFKSNNQFQNVYLTDEHKNIICINFWGGIKKFGFENVLDTGQIVACVNLQKRAGNTRRNIQHYRATEFTYFTKTPKSVAARKNIDELSKIISTINKTKFIDDCVHLKNNCNSENYSPYRFINHDLSKNKIFMDSPKINTLHEDFNLSGLDFESTFKHTGTQELSPNSLSRRKKINEKIAKLKSYGEPPPLCPINIINKSKSATMTYKSPLIKDNSVTSIKSDIAKVTDRNSIPKNSNELEINCSPVLPVNRTYVKSVKPVKLDFNSVAIEENEEVDHFAEEFDASPPLSLD